MHSDGELDGQLDMYPFGPFFRTNKTAVQDQLDGASICGTMGDERGAPRIDATEVDSTCRSEVDQVRPVRQQAARGGRPQCERFP